MAEARDTSGGRQSSFLHQGMAAARANLRPALFLQVVAVLVFVGYHHHETTRAVLARVAEAKLEYGYGFSLVSTAFFAALVPFFLQRLQRGGRGQVPLAHLPFLLVFWGLKGIEVDALYRLQAVLFGAEPKLGGLVLKVLVDQLVYVPIWAVPSTVLAYLWKDRGARTAFASVGRRWYGQSVLPVLVANWLVWLPTVTVIYTLEVPLQLPVQNLVLCLWALLVQFFTGEEARRET